MKRSAESPPRPRRAWAPTTTWLATGLAALAAALLVVLAYAGPIRTVTEVDFSGARVFVARLAGGAFLAVLTLSCLLQAALYLPQRTSRRVGLPAPAVLDLVVVAGVVTEAVLVLTAGFHDAPSRDTLIVSSGLGIALVAVLRFVLIAASGIQELVARRRAAAEAPPPPAP